jgi:hypothetical protein
LIRFLLTAAIAIPLMAAFPLAAVALSRAPTGAQILFWAGPWSAAFYTLIYSVLSAAPWRLGGAAVRQWRYEQGGLLVTSLHATGWMFFGLIASYAADFLMLFLVRPSPSGRALLPLFTYSPVAFCWCWRRIHA